MSDSTTLTARTWPEGTHVTLMNVPWDESYRDVVAWSSVAERDQWLDSQADVVLGSTVTFTYLWPNQPVSVPIPYSSCYRFNYCVVDNPAQPVDGEGPLRRYCYFVTGVEYLSPQASRLTLQLDVMTTYAGQIELGRAFVERGHIAMANSNARGGMTGEKLLEYMSLPEGINIGRSYQTVSKHYLPLSYELGDGSGTSPENMMIVVVSTADLTADPGTVNSPNLVTATGDMADAVPSGCSVYCLHPGNFGLLMEAASKYSWVSQCIICLYAFPEHFMFLGTEVQILGGVRAYPMLGIVSDEIDPTGIRQFSSIPNALGELEVAGTEDVEKLKCYPYSVIELSAGTGESVILRPELLSGNELVINCITCALMPFARIGFFPEHYNAPAGKEDVTYRFSSLQGTVRDAVVEQGDFLDVCVWVSDFPQFSIVNNSYITYLASSANTRQFAYDSAAWSLDRSNAQANNAMANAKASWEAKYAADYEQGLAMVRNANAGFIGGMVSGVAGGALGAAGDLIGGGTQRSGMIGAALGATGSLVSTITSAEQAMQVAQNNVTAFGNTADINRDLSRELAGNNRKLADLVNNGDYQMQIAGIEATCEDAQLRPPSIVGQSGGNGIRFKNGYTGLSVNFKTIVGAARASVADYFRRYGYAVRRWLDTGTVRHMLCMEHFAYWKLLETYVIAAPANESERQTIRGVFEKGVTLWDAPESIGNTAATDNAPRAGYSY